MSPVASCGSHDSSSGAGSQPRYVLGRFGHRALCHRCGSGDKFKAAKSFRHTVPKSHPLVEMYACRLSLYRDSTVKESLERLTPQPKPTCQVANAQCASAQLRSRLHSRDCRCTFAIEAAPMRFRQLCTPPLLLSKQWCFPNVDWPSHTSPLIF